MGDVANWKLLQSNALQEFMLHVWESCSFSSEAQWSLPRTFHSNFREGKIFWTYQNNIIYLISQYVEARLLAICRGLYLGMW